MTVATSRMSPRKTLTDGEANIIEGAPNLTATAPAEQQYDDPCEAEYFRTWTSPDLPNPELVSLLAVFPAFISGRTLPRFTVSTVKRRPADLEEADNDALESIRDEVRFGTGVMWVGAKGRSDGWQGSWWERFTAWWRRMLC